MTVLEAGISSQQVEIIGTDLCQKVVERARSGHYVQFEVNRGLSPALLAKYFTKAGADWQAKDILRSMTSFEKMDLRGSFSSVGHCDLILCRNVLIYFDVETKKQILTSIARSLVPGGLLILGCAETLINMESGFERRVIGQTTFYAARS